jgi:GMP synthase-like glutamine amidotransferase
MLEMARIHYLQHVPFEGPANIANWAESRGHELAGTRLYAGESLPDVAELDWLVIMGGPMGANDDHKHDWMGPEKELIEATLSAAQPVIGVCLGAQLIASVLGARVYRNAEKEIGWWPVRKATGLPLESAFSSVPEMFTPLHWHGDTFDLPAGARRIASSEGCVNQAFEYHTALALQFHIEATKQSVDALLKHCVDEIDGGPHQQDPEGIARCDAQASALEPILFGVLDQLAR